MKKLLSFSAIMGAFLPIGRAFAVTLLTAPQPITSTGELLGYICTLGNILFTTLMIFAVVVFLYGAFLFATSGGDRERTSSARKTITYAVAGILVAVLSKGVVVVVTDIFSVSEVPECD